jgi:SAM-dependent methyltransferase
MFAVNRGRIEIMDQLQTTPTPKRSARIDWDAIYREGTPPWDAGKPHAELVRVLDEYKIKPCTALEIGCGSGADAILLARRRFELTAIDCSPIAVERARLRAEQHDALLRFVQDDVFDFARHTEPFDFVYDAGLYHAVRQTRLEQYLDMLWRVTRPGSMYLGLIGAPRAEKGTCPVFAPTNAAHRCPPSGSSGKLAPSPVPPEAGDVGPPQVEEEQIREELGRLLEFIHLRPTLLEGSDPNRAFPAWSCLMRR